jgi:hypothetical protein
MMMMIVLHEWRAPKSESARASCCQLLHPQAVAVTLFGYAASNGRASSSNFERVTLPMLWLDGMMMMMMVSRYQGSN